MTCIYKTIFFLCLQLKIFCYLYIYNSVYIIERVTENKMIELKKYDDQKLLEFLREKNQMRDRAFDVLFNRYSAKVNAFCYFKCTNKSIAEEIFEDTWLRFLDAVQNGKLIENVLSYLYKICINLIIDRIREINSSKSLKIEYTDLNNLDTLVNPDEYFSKMENEELITMIKIAVDNLDEIYRETFVMYWFGGLSQKEIAEVLDISLGSVKMRNHRAMQEVVRILKPQFELNSR